MLIKIKLKKMMTLDINHNNDYDYGFINEINTGNASIPESITKKLYNSIVRIELSNDNATGFFMKVKIKSIYLPCLLTNFHVINHTHVNEKITIDLFFGERERERKISIKLDTNKRFI